jgi:hypothetical protein
MSRRANANVDLSRHYLCRDLVDGRKTRRALTVDGRDRGRDGDASVESGHTSSGRATGRRKDVSNTDILDKCWVKVDLGVDCTKDAREDLLWACVLETTTLAL